MSEFKSKQESCSLCMHVVTNIIHFVPRGMSIERYIAERKALETLCDKDVPELSHTSRVEIVGFDNHVCKLGLKIKHNGDCPHFIEGAGSGFDVYACRFGVKKLTDLDKANRECLKKSVEEAMWRYYTKQLEE
jgi:hypothetical protein